MKNNYENKHSYIAGQRNLCDDDLEALVSQINLVTWQAPAERLRLPWLL